VEAVRRMVTASARVIVCLGGDGTARVAASAAGDVPMLALSTGTNNVFPAVREATIVGLAAGLAAAGLVPVEGATTRAKLLEVRAGDRTETALVDIAVSTERHVGARAVWDPATVTQLFWALAEPDAIGLSSVLGQLCPVARHEPHGVTARLSADAPRQVLAPIAPGLVVPVGVHEIEPMHPGAAHRGRGACWQCQGFPLHRVGHVLLLDGWSWWHGGASEQAEAGTGRQDRGNVHAPWPVGPQPDGWLLAWPEGELAFAVHGDDAGSCVDGLDEDTVLESVEGTGRLVVVDESHPRCSIATDISALVARKAFGALRAPIEMVSAPHTPVPFSTALEDLYIYIPDAQRVVNAT
jgi:hypothetical protein